MMYYITCEWFDDKGIRREDTFEESKLVFLENLARAIIEGFSKKG